MAAEILTAGDGIVTAILEWWQSQDPAMGPADAVSLAFQPDINLDPQEGDPRPSGRHVYVVPLESRHDGMIDRAGDDDKQSFVVVIAEFFNDGPDAPPVAWVRERVEFSVAVWKLVRDARPVPEVVTGFRPEDAPVLPVLDDRMLLTNRAFATSFGVTYATIADPDPGE